jgi:hypothetical protein
MAEKPKKKTAKPKRPAPDVMSSLSTQRPARIATGRGGSARPAAPKTTTSTRAATAAAESATPEPKDASAKPKTTTAAKPKAPRAKPAAAKPKAASAKTTAAAKRESAARPTPRATATRRKAAAPRTFEPTPAAESAAGPADERAAGAPTDAPREAAATYPRPRAVREGAPGIGTTTLRDQPASAESGPPSGPELVTGAVKAAGQVAQIGLAIGGQLVKKAVERLPKP